MSVKKAFLSLAAAVVLSLMVVGSSFSAPEDEASQGRERRVRSTRPTTRPNSRAPRERMSAEERAKAAVDRMKDQIGATDSQWQVIEPKLLKVMTLSRQQSGYFGMGRTTRARGERAGRGERGGRGDGERGERGERAARGQTEVEKSALELRKALNDKSDPEQIKAKLSALRAAKEKAEKELAAAKGDLKKSLTVNQEAQLVLMNVID